MCMCVKYVWSLREREYVGFVVELVEFVGKTERERLISKWWAVENVCV